MNEAPLAPDPIKQDTSVGRHKTLIIASAVILALVAIAGIAYSVYAWQQNRQLSADVTTKNSQIADLQKQATTPAKTTPTQTTPADPYSGWKTYCDTVEKACFKYPADWSIDIPGQGSVTVGLRSSTGSVVGTYTSNDTRDSMQAPFYSAALEDLSTPNASFKVVGGFVASAATATPQYRVVDTSFTTGLTVGQQTSMENTARFTFRDLKMTGHLEIFPASASGMSQNQAKTWFTTGDAKTALLLAKSFYLE